MLMDIFLTALVFAAGMLAGCYVLPKSYKDRIPGLQKVGALFSASAVVLIIQSAIGTAPEFLSELGYIFFGFQGILLLAAAVDVLFNDILVNRKCGG